MKLTIAIFALAMTAHAAGFDGRWTAQTAVRNKKAADKPVTFTLDLKALDGKVTGTVSVSGGRKSRPQTIENGKIEGGRISFGTHVKNKKADASFQWTATLNGDELTGTRTREGAKRGQQFTAKRSN